MIIGKFSSCLHDIQIVNMHTSQVIGMYEGYVVSMHKTRDGEFRRVSILINST